MTNNFGIEFWVNPTSTSGGQSLAYNGNPALNGAGIYLTNGSYQARIGTTAFATTTATAATWIHLAFVRNNGTATLYVNGTAAGTSTVNPVLPTAQFGLGANPFDASEKTVAYMDEVRVFTFTAGQFSTNDLLLNAGLPVVSSVNASAITGTNATLTGSVNPTALTTTYYFQYGPSASYGSKSANTVLAPATNASAVTYVATNLSGFSLYHYQLVASNSAGKVTSADATFSTTAVLPALTNLAATTVTTNSAVLNATVNPNGAPTGLSFQYGLTTNYGNNSSTQLIQNTRLSFNGTNQTASLAAHPNWLGTGNIPHTIEAWINPAFLPSVRSWPLLLGTTGTGSHHWLINANGIAQIGSYGVASVTNLLPVGVWTHIAASFDGTALSVYTNGVLISVSNITFNLQGASLLLAQSQLSENYFSGGIDEVRIWNTARSASQIQTNFARTLTGSESGLVGYYRMDEGSGTNVTDLTGHGNTLVTANSPAWTTSAPPLNYAAQIPISTLAPGSLYHFNVIATNSSGSSSGTDLTFTTPAAAPTLTLTNASALTVSSALLNAQINPNGAATAYYFQYGLTASYGSVTATNLLTATNVFVVAGVAITNLPPATTYHYCVVASNSVGLITGVDQTFATASVLPSITTPTASAVTAVSALLSAQINPNNLAATWYFQYGTNTSYGRATVTNALTATNVFVFTNVTVTNLQPATTYHYRLVAVNSVGTTNGPDQTFITTGGLPLLTVQPVSAITASSARLNAQINPNSLATTCYFQYGATASYGSNTVATLLTATNIPVATNAAISGLQMFTLYHYRVVASNSVGTTNGPDQTFSTVADRPIVSTLPATNITLTTATLNGSVNPNGAYSTWFYQYGTSISYGSVTPVLPVIQGLTFDGGTVALLRYDSLNSWATGHQPHTMEAWLNPTLAPPGREWVSLLGGFGVGSHHWLLNQDGTAQIGVFAGDQVTITLASNVWTHLAASYDGTFLNVYTNGQLAGTTTADFELQDKTLYLSQAYGSDSYFAGGMAEFRLWNTGRSQAEIQATMNSSITNPQTGLIVCLPLSEGSGDLAIDLAANNAFPIYGDPTWTTVLPSVLTPVNFSTRPLSQILTNLIPGTTYHFQLVASNSAGVSTGADLTFTNLVLPPTITLLPISNVSTSGVTFHATVNPQNLASAGYFQYGLTTNYGSKATSFSLPAENAADPYDVSITGLVPGALYHYQLVATNQGGVSLSADQTFFAGLTPDVTLAVSGVTPTNATLNVIIHPHGLAAGGRLDWGAMMNFGHQIALPAVNSNAPVSFSFPVTNLVFGQPYHFRVFASNAVGCTLGREFHFYANALNLNGNAILTNELSTPFTDPGAFPTALPSAIAAGDYASYAIRADGQGVAWGGYNNSFGDTIIPSGATNLASIRGSANHPAGIALGQDGSIFSIGAYSLYGAVPGDLYQAMAFAEGQDFAMALQGDGTVRGWGSDPAANVPAAATNVIAIAAGYNVGAALRADGSVIAWGNNGNGQTNVPANATNVIDLASANGSIVALRADGSVVLWGYNPGIPVDATNLVSISGGSSHYLGLRADGKLFTWGFDSGSGEFSIPADATNIVAVAAGAYYSQALRADGKLFRWGANQYNSSAGPVVTNLNLPVFVSGAVNTNLPGTYILTYSTTNAFGYVATATRSIIVLASPPVAITQPASAVTNGSATLQGLVSLNHGATAAYFQYGTTTGYGGNTVSSVPVLPTSGVVFNGVNDGLGQIDFLQGMPSGNSPHTIEAWLKPTLQPAGREWVLLYGDVASGSHHWLLNKSGSAQIGCFGGAQFSPQLAPNVWTHVAASFDGANLSVYTNGVLVGTTAASFNVNGASLTLAADRIGESYFGGGMDKVAIWSTGRTAQQVKTDMLTRYSGTEPGLALYLQLEEETGRQANSAVSNAVNYLGSVDDIVWGSGTPLTQMVVTQKVTGLALNGTCHYRVVATNFGGITYGEDMTFLLGTGFPSAVPFSIYGSTASTNGNFQFSFTNTPGARFTVLTHTNVGAPLTNWLVLSNVVENPPGNFSFSISPGGTNYRYRFFRVQSP